MVILQEKIAGLTEGMVERFVLRARRALGMGGAVNVLVTSNRELRSLNRRFRGKDKATDVLSFPASPASQFRGADFAGDIAISAQAAAQSAVSFGHSAAEEVKILALHGLLHLAGFDHESDNGQMARKEARLRKVLRLSSVLTERTQAGQESSRKILGAGTGTRTRRNA